MTGMAKTREQIGGSARIKNHSLIFFCRDVATVEVSHFMCPSCSDACGELSQSVHS